VGLLLKFYCLILCEIDKLTRKGAEFWILLLSIFDREPNCGVNSAQKIARNRWVRIKGLLIGPGLHFVKFGVILRLFPKEYQMGLENPFGFIEIPNDELSDDNLPGPEADWRDISYFALSYDGYSRLGSTKNCGKLANAAKARFEESGAVPDSMDDLRVCLFFEQRRWHHFGQHPDGDTLIYIHALMDAIREKAKK